MAPLSCDEVRELAAGFVLGALDPDDMARLRRHLSICPDPHREIAEMGQVVPYLGEALEPIEPPAGLGQRILAAVAAEAAQTAAAQTADGDPGTVSGPSPGAPRPRTAGPSVAVVPLATDRARRPSRLTWIAAIAAALVIAALGAWNVGLRTELDSLRAYDKAVERVVNLATAAGGQAAILRPQVTGGPAGMAAIGADGRIEIALRGLAPTSGSEVYEAWLIGPDKRPVAIGSVTLTSDGLGVLQTTAAPTGQGVTIALTREPTAGRTNPTPPVLSVGVASGAT
jgi:anti-sigma factor RsiW